MFMRITTAALLVLMSTASFAKSANEYFSDGIAAFKQHRFNDAISHFKLAKNAGVKGTHLEYNMGVTYYKLEKYELAKKSFLVVAVDTKYQQVAHYNLGLVARRLKNYTNALVWFKKASASNDQKAISKLADNMIKKVSPKVSSSAIQRMAAKASSSSVKGENSLMPNNADLYSGLKNSISRKSSNQAVASSYNDPATSNDEISRGSADEVEIIRAPRKETGKKGKIRGGLQIAIGNDDNIDSVANDGVTQISDSYVEAFGYISIPITKDWKILGNFYRANFNDSDEDYTSITAGVKYSTKIGSWGISPKITHTKSSLSSEDYQSINHYSVTGTNKLGAGKWLVLRYRYSDISADNTRFSYEEGDRHQFRVDYYTRLAFAKLRVRYQHETNDRDDDTSSTNASPTRNELRIRLKRKFAERWTWATEVSFRSSDYGTDSINRDRKDDRSRVSLGLDRKMNKRWKVGTIYKYTDNDSNFDTYTYDKRDFQIYSLWTF